MYPHHLHSHRHIPDEVCYKITRGKQIIEIILLKDEIIHDIDADTLQVEKARKIEGVTVATDESRSYEACRYIDKAVNAVVAKCAAYLLLPSPYAHRISDNHNKGWEEKSIYLGLPHNWPPHLIDHVRDLIHDHIVKYAEAQLLAPVLSPQDSYVQSLLLDAESSLNSLNAAINSRLGPTHIHPTFLG